MQNLLFVSNAVVKGYRKPSSKTCPRCPPHVEPLTSLVVTIAFDSLLIPVGNTTGSISTTADGVSPAAVPSAAAMMGDEKLGHPVPLLNLLSEANRSDRHPAHRYVPRRVSPMSRREVKGLSVTDNLSTPYWIGSSRDCHSFGEWRTG